MVPFKSFSVFLSEIGLLTEAKVYVFLLGIRGEHFEIQGQMKK